MEQEFNEFSEFRYSDPLLMHEWASIKDPLCFLCLAGTLPLVFKQEVAGSNNLFNYKYLASLKHLGRTQMNHQVLDDTFDVRFCFLNSSTP